MPTLPTNDLELYYETLGEGPPLLLIAGLASDSRSWATVREELAKDYLLIIPDNRGVGRTTPQHLAVSVDRISADCVALIRHLGLPRVHCLGHSMGGVVALEIAQRYPQVLNRLVLAATPSHISPRNQALFADWVAWRESGMDLKMWFRNLFYWILSPGFFTDQQQLEQALQAAVSDPFPQTLAAFRSQVAALTNWNNPDWNRIQSPALVVSGCRDILFDPSDGEELTARLPYAEQVVLNAAHAIHLEQPAEFVRAVRSHLKG